MTERGLRYNAGKTRWSLVAWDAVECVAKVATFGATVYPARNWERGMPYSEVLDSLHRHLHAWRCGEDNDTAPGGSGLPHLAHVAWNALALLAYELRGKGEMFDDIPGRRKDDDEM